MGSFEAHFYQPTTSKRPLNLLINVILGPSEPRGGSMDLHRSEGPDQASDGSALDWNRLLRPAILRSASRQCLETQFRRFQTKRRVVECGQKLNLLLNYICSESGKLLIVICLVKEDLVHLI